MKRIRNQDDGRESGVARIADFLESDRETIRNARRTRACRIWISMKVQTLIQSPSGLCSAEVEVVLIPGLPQIHVLGLPDQALRESLHRIRGALRVQGFDWPKSKQILVNIRPVDRKKSSRGLDLAIAAGILWETGQAARPLFETDFFVYGELTLEGEVLEPEDLQGEFRGKAGARILTGRRTDSQPRAFSCDRISDLRQIDRPEREHACQSGPAPLRPKEGLQRRYSSPEARWISMMSVGEHHWLLAGVAGSGKSTLARSLRSFLRAPSEQDLRHGRWNDLWRPLRAPHHSVGSKGMTGGGSDPRPGEVTRADGGILLLDELLEFPASVQEALREPVESGFIDLSRSFNTARFPSRFIMVGTTNLCPCGRWIPGQRPRCTLSFKRCRSVISRISGPFFDRFHGLSLVGARKEPRDLDGFRLLAQIEVAQEFRQHRLATLEETTPDQPPPGGRAFDLAVESGSDRRRNALFAIARTLADLEQTDHPLHRHYEEAYEYTVESFSKLQHADEGV